MYEDYEITIAAGATVTFDGASLTNTTCNAPAVKCLGNATIVLAEGSDNSVVNMVDHYSAIYPAANATLTIQGSGSLNVAAPGTSFKNYGAAIGSYSGGSYNTGTPCGNIVISGGNITAVGGYCGAGVGACSYDAVCGDITITGDAVVHATGGAWAAGIGAASDRSPCGSITISGNASVTATSTAYSDANSAGIGAGYDSTCGDITISTTGTVEAQGVLAAGIGAGGYFGAACAGITITSGIITATGGGDACAIGASFKAGCGDILIEGGTITATGGEDCPGVGALGETASITITGGNVTAIGGSNGSRRNGGAGIGSMYYRTCGNITISGGTVTATGGAWAAGIGSGYEGTCSNITISAGMVTANVCTSTGDGETDTVAIGAGCRGTCGNILISGGTVVANATNPQNASKDFNSAIGATYYNSKCGDITITDGITSVTATKGATAQQHIGQGDGSATIGTITYGSHLKQTLSNNDLTATYEPHYVEISDVAGLNAIASDLSGLYRLIADIDLQNVAREPFGEFTGVFDGNGHAIRNISITSGGSTVGLFSRLNGATVRNLTLEGGRIEGYSDVGGIVGEVSGGALIEDCSVNMTIVANQYSAGGFVGYAASGMTEIRRCRSFSDVTSVAGEGGGFIGYINGEVAVCDSYALDGSITSRTGTRSGGLVGFKNNGTLAISNCYHATYLYSNGNGDGRFVGNGDNNLVNGCYWDADIVGQASSAAGEAGLATAQMKSGDPFEGWDTTVWKFTEGQYPRLRALIPKYTATWKDDDGTTLETDGEVEEFDTPAFGGATPTKAATAQYTYTFAGWTPAVVAIESNTTYTATYDATVNEYEITWLSDDDSVIDLTSVAYGDTPALPTPTKAATAQYTYEFAGWTPAVAPVTGTATYKATFTPTLRSYTVTWKDDDGTTLGEDTLAYGSTPSRAAPSKAATAQYTFAFTGWSPAISTVTGEATYTATYSQTVNTYTISWKDDDGTLLRADTLEYGATPSYGGSPSKAEDTYNTYTFLGWGPAVVAVTGNAIYTATYMAHSKWTGQGTAVEPYTLATPARISEILALDGGSSSEIFVQTGGDVTAESIGAELPAGYAVRATGTAGVVKVVQILEVVWYDDDGTLLRRDEADAGSMPSYGSIPTKASTAQYDYTFAGWTPAVVAVTESATYTATYTPTLRSYTITWLDADGTSLGTTTVAYGGTPAHAAPASAYTFTGWSPAISTVTGEATYTATYSHEVLLANLTGDYTAADGDVLTGTTAHNVTVPGGATVTVNGVSITGAGGGAAPEPPTFDANAEAATTKFGLGADGKWHIVAFAELATGTAAGTDGMITVLRGSTPDAVATPVTPDELATANAVKVEAVVAPTAGAEREFFKVRFGK